MTEEELASKILQQRNRNWIQEQIKLQIEIQYQNAASFECLVSIRKSIQLREHFNWLVWSLAQFYFQQKPQENTFNLPKVNTRKWTDGFEYKGVYIRVLPYEDAYFVQNEILALKYVQTELLELNSMSLQLQQQYGSTKENLHKDVILPLLTGVSCGGFYLYASPAIYTQELDSTKEFYKDQQLNGSKVFQGQNSMIFNNQNSIHMQAVINQSNASFSYLHNNISPEFVQDSLFKFMPVLKNIRTVNMIPIIDFEDYNMKPNEEQKEDVELKYLLVNLFDVLPRLGEVKASTHLIRFPSFINDEITFHSFPKDHMLEIRELKDMINSQSEQDLNADDEEEQQVDINSAFTKKYFIKQGWDFVLMQKKGITNENKRATAFYMSKEIPLTRRQPETANQNNILFADEYVAQDNINHEEIKQPSQYISAHKPSIFKRNDSTTEKDNKVCGNVLLSAYNFKKDFKLQYSMNNHTLSTNIEALFSASTEQVVKIIEQSDNIYNSQSIKELFHRKGLNLRFQWVALVKLRQNTQRDQIMIDILLRVMRRIVNEEIKMKGLVQHPVPPNEGTNAIFEEFYQGSQIDSYKEYLTSFMNTILKRKVQKNKQIFDETLLGLFLSRMSILGILYSLNLRKEEFFYLESKDILEDIIDAPSRNPTYFMNAVQTYFKIEFKPEILRLCRQDKHLFLSKSQPVSKNEIKQIQLKMHNYFSLREQAYFLLARQITNASNKESPSKKIASKIKTKGEKDKLKQSFQKPNKETAITSSFIQNSARSKQNQSGIGPQGILNHQDSALESQETKTNRVQNNHIIGNKESLSTIRQYHNMDKAIMNDSAEFGSPPINQSKLTKLQTNQEQMIDFSKLSKRNNFKPTQMSEIIFPSVLYKLKTYLSSNPMYYFDDQSKTYIGDTLTVLKSYYEMPSIDIVDEWVMILESQLKDVYSVNGSEQVLLEAFIYQALLIYFFRNDQEELLKVLTKIRDMLVTLSSCAPETLILTQILSGMFFEEQKDQHSIEAERSYLISMICILNMYGDPRGRGNMTIPYSLYISWKLSLISLAEDKKLHDSEFAEEIFDSSLRCLFNHKRCYREQQIKSMLQTKNTGKPSQDVPPLSQFEIELEKAELAKQLFDMKKYKSKPFNITFASGLPKSNTILINSKQNYSSSNSKYKQEASVVYVSSNHNFNERKSNKKKSNNLTLPLDKNESLRSKSHIQGLKKRQNHNTNEYDIDLSEIDLEVEDENQNIFVEENFKSNEWYIGECPFQHWSLYRQQIAQILQAHNPVIAKNNQAQSQYQKQIYKDMLQKFLPKDLFYQWLLKFNPMMYQSGLQWSNEVIKNVIFCSNQQMISSSGSSAVMSSNHNLSSSHQSLSSSAPTSAKEKRNMHLGSYSQILGKEVGGINKQEMSGVIFSMGTDNNGQLGLDVISMNEPSMHTASLKVLYPRMVVALRDEIIKEICCGNSHTLVININGQVFAWGANQTGQLGLGDDAPSFIKKPVLNPYLQNIAKLSAGYEHSIALTKNNELYIWGSGGLSGQGTLKQQNIPAKMEFFSKTKVMTAVCGGLHTIAVNKEGEAFSWGLTEGGQLGLPQQQIVKLCQGQGDDPQVLTPQRIPKLEGLFITQVACGEAHSIAMTKDGSLYGWGQSNYGQLGLGFSGDSFEPGLGMEKSKVYEPSQITGLSHERVSKIVCGATFTLFQTDKGDLYGCGVNDLGQLGLDTFMEEMQIASLEKVKKGKHNQTSDVTLPTKVICFQGIAIHQIACGESHSLAVSGDGMNMLWAWGMFKNGQLGLGEVTMKMNPRPVQTLCSSQIQRVACGSMHSLALIGDSNQVSTFSSQYYASNDTLKNYWICDLRGLATKGQNQFNDDPQDDEVPDDGEGKVKNPK